MRAKKKEKSCANVGQEVKKRLVADYRAARNPKRWDDSPELPPALAEGSQQSQIYDRGWVSLACFGQLYKARSRLYRSQILQVNTRWKALDEIYYKIYMLLHRSDLNISAKCFHVFLAFSKIEMLFFFDFFKFRRDFR